MLIDALVGRRAAGRPLFGTPAVRPPPADIRGLRLRAPRWPGGTPAVRHTHRSAAAGDALLGETLAARAGSVGRLSCGSCWAAWPGDMVADGYRVVRLAPSACSRWGYSNPSDVNLGLSITRH
jgi:hypothetical protein